MISFKPLRSGALRGLCNIEWTAAGLILEQVSVFASGEKRWAALPAAPVIDSERRHHVVNGRRQYRQLIHWKDRERADRFSDRIIALVAAKYPHAFDEADAGEPVSTPNP